MAVPLDSLGRLQVCLTSAQFFRNVFCEAKDSTWYFSSPRVNTVSQSIFEFLMLGQRSRGGLSDERWLLCSDERRSGGAETSLEPPGTLQEHRCCAMAFRVGAEHPAQGQELQWLREVGPRQGGGKSGPVSGHWVTAGKHTRVGARLSPPGATSLASSPTLTTRRPLRLRG